MPSKKENNCGHVKGRNILLLLIENFLCYINIYLAYVDIKIFIHLGI